MGKDKLKRFAENQNFQNFFQPSAQEMFKNNFFLKGKWNTRFFKNNNPIVLEIGCGKGEYTTGLAQKYPEKNFIGIDFKGARIWKGLKTAEQYNLTNVAFIRNKIEFINSFFSQNEISEIWITFPDPQPSKSKKRLTSPRFLKNYSEILIPGGTVNLKTDSKLMHLYTLAVIEQNNLKNIFASDNIYSLPDIHDDLKIKTFYETKFLAQNIPITYVKFSLKKDVEYFHPDFKFDF